MSVIRFKTASRRGVSNRPYRKRFVISTEGKTEIQYFKLLNRLCKGVSLRCISPGSQSAPTHVLRRMKEFIRKDGGQVPSDEYWLVTDRNSWQEEQLMQSFEWSETRENFGFALSNPKFEYWLLLHFEDGYNVGNSAECSRRLKRYLPDYRKSVEQTRFTMKDIMRAVERAKIVDYPPCQDWPKRSGITTIYKLVQAIIDSSASGNL